MPMALIFELSLGVTWLMMDTQMGSFRCMTHLSSITGPMVRGST